MSEMIPEMKMQYDLLEVNVKPCCEWVTQEDLEMIKYVVEIESSLLALPVVEMRF